MKKPISAARLRDQAYRCEHAKHKRCKCRCGGALHGTKHDECWIEVEVERDKVRFATAGNQLDWVGYAGFEQYL
jgi:hypothetical protein